ncbi:MAG: AMP-binding protein [Gammaproteobacteria bacterium]|nr:AMP-binding protein [Gammaproteobacteria bacterium]MDH5311427.1 AMP-binding protein [Gammaproteobacteria bacterium]
MSVVIEALAAWQKRTPDAIALCDSTRVVQYGELADRVGETASVLEAHGSRCVALLADNSIDWIIADLAALQAGITMIPLPPFFSDTQLQHLLASAPIDTLLADDAARVAGVAAGFEPRRGRVGGLEMFCRDRSLVPPYEASISVAKITFTSGSTGQPKGVCLARAGLEQTAQGLAAALSDLGIRRHLCVMPLATLLENIAGVYAPILLGASIRVLPLREVGITGSSRLNVAVLRHAIGKTGAESVILLPQVLQDLTSEVSERPWPGCPLKFVAVGGARISDQDVEDADAAGIPVFQGYGLSECNSVVALNRPSASRNGSVGKPLPGISIRIAADGEIIVSGSCMIGYLGDEPVSGGELATGDLGRLDVDGFLYVTGRKKSMFITSFGRNVSPEWPEAELMHQPEIAQAVVFGEARAFNTAVLVPADPGTGPRQLAAAVARANGKLPDYARIAEWIIVCEPFTTANGLLTPSGKPRREAVILRHILDPEPVALQA